MKFQTQKIYLYFFFHLENYESQQHIQPQSHQMQVMSSNINVNPLSNKTVDVKLFCESESIFL